MDKVAAKKWKRQLSARILRGQRLTVNLGRAQIFFVALVLLGSAMSIFADLNVGGTYRINSVDVDGNTFSTADGHITILALTNQANIDKARAVGDRVPEFCVGNSEYRMITVVAFEKKHSRPVQAILRSLVRGRLDSEARRIQARYDRLKISRDARRDVFAIADFDGAVAAQLDAKWETNLFRIFIFGKNGVLRKHWSDVPDAEELAASLKQN